MAVALVIGIVASGLVYLAVVRGGTHGTGARSSPSASASSSGMQAPVTADSRLEADGGTVVFSDDFKDPSSGWFTGTAASGTTYQYSSAGYVITGKESLHHLSFAPYSRRLAQLSVETSATQTFGAPNGAGFGVVCDTGQGSSEVHYSLLVLQPGTWFLERTDGPVSPTNGVTILKQGTALGIPGPTPLRITGMCATLADGHTIRLALFVNGILAADTTDSTTETVVGWVGGIVTSTRAGQVTTVTFTKFEERDLSGRG